MYVLGGRVALLFDTVGVIRSRHLLIKTREALRPWGRRRIEAVRIRCSGGPKRGEIIANIISSVQLRRSHLLRPHEYDTRVGRSHSCTDVRVHAYGFVLVLTVLMLVVKCAHSGVCTIDQIYIVLRLVTQSWLSIFT